MPRSAAPVDPSRQIMIHTKACQRLAKETAHYRQEAAERDQVWKEMEKNGNDPYDIKRYKGLWEESYAMIPDAVERHGQAVEHLRQLLAESCATTTADNIRNNDDEWYKSAERLIAEYDKDKKQDGSDMISSFQTPVDLPEGEAF